MDKERLQDIISLPKVILMLILIGSALILHACASSQTSVQTNKAENKQLNKGEESFAFYDTTGGQHAYWKAIFKDHKLRDLYKNGIQIPDSLMPDYKDLVFDRLDEVSGNHKKFSFRIQGFPFDSTFFKHKKHFKDHSMWIIPDSCFPFFDNKSFQIEMDSLNKELGELKHFRYHFNFDSLKFGDNMKKMMEDLKHMKFDSSEFNMNMKEFEENMKKFEKEMRNKKFWFNYDLSDLDHKLKNLNHNMFNLNLDLTKVNQKLRELNEFIDAVKTELVKDGILKNKDQKAEIILGPDSMTVNGKKLSNKQLEKYKKLYSKYFSEELTVEEHFHLN
jgi:hypothetical protein